jgi:hypothetical protein
MDQLIGHMGWFFAGLIVGAAIGAYSFYIRGQLDMMTELLSILMEKRRR